MDRRFVTVLGVSLVFALVVSSVFYQMTAHSATNKNAAQEQKDLVVASKPLSVGLMVKAPDVKLIKVPADQFPKGGYSKIEDVTDRSIISNILQDEALVDGRLGAKGGGLGLAPQIPVGMRAVTIRVTDTASVAGYVQSGMHVDITVTGHPPSDGSTLTKTFLQNIPVLSAGTNLQPDPKGQATPVPTVTLLVNPDQAEILTLANNGGGQIQLILRNSGDDKVTETKGSSLEELYGGKRTKGVKEQDFDPQPPKRSRPAPAPSVAAPVAATPVAPPVVHEIVTIRGNTKTTELFDANGKPIPSGGGGSTMPTLDPNKPLSLGKP